MKRTILNPKSIPGRNKPYSQGFLVEARRLLFVAGQVPVDENGAVVGKQDIARQLEQVFINLGAVLESAGANFSNVVKFNTFLVNRRDMPAFYAARLSLYKKIFPDADYPPNTLVVVGGLASEEFLLEIEAIAALD